MTIAPEPAEPTEEAPGSVRRQSLVGLRLRKHADYQRAYAAARKRQSASMSWFLAPQPTAFHESADEEWAERDLATGLPGSPRVGLTAGKVLGKAHERNRIKRRMRDVLRRHADLLPQGFDLILHPRRSVLTMEFRKLEAEIVRILEQANAGRKGALEPGSRSRAPDASNPMPAQPGSAQPKPAS